MAEQVRNDIKRIDFVADLSSSISLLEEIKLLQRKQAWEILPDKYSHVRSLLTTVKNIIPTINNEQKKIIQSCIVMLRGIEFDIETSIYNNGSFPDIPRLNQSISKQMEKLNQILNEIKNQIGR